MLESIVFIIDDDDAFRGMLEIAAVRAGFAVRTFDRGLEFLECIQVEQPGCVVLETSLPDVDGLRVQSELLRRGVPLPVIFLTSVATIRDSVAAMQRGAVDFIEKSADLEVLVARIQQALELDREGRDKGNTRREICTRLARLTRRETEVAELIVHGLPTKQIAAQFDVSPNTVENQRASILRKMGANSAIDVVRMWMLAHVGDSIRRRDGAHALTDANRS